MVNPAQEDRIAAAAKELERALNDTGENFDIDLQTITHQTISSRHEQFTHTVIVTQNTQRRIYP